MSVLNQGSEDAVECPLCMEPLEVDDLNFFPCTCGYQICRFCWHRIRTDENGLCPACRKAYSENPADFKPLSKEEIAKLKAEKRLKDQQRKQRVTENRKHLANVRVVQKNLVFVVGLPMRLADPDVLKKHEYFGKFGKIHKVVINQSTSYAGSQGPSASAYVTYQRQEDALRAIEAVNNIAVDGRTIKTSLGTTKYCSHFMRNQSCPKPDCMYLHDLGDQEASFTKEEMHQGKHQEYEKKLVQSLHANTSIQRKPTPSPPASGNVVQNTGMSNSQTKEAWPSLQSGQTNCSQINFKDPSLPVEIASQNNVINENTTNIQQNLSSPTVPTKKQSNNNNNKGESGIGFRRGKSNSESKVQAARNKHKNCQNKEKHNVRGGTTQSSDLNNASAELGTQNKTQSLVNGQKEVRNCSAESLIEAEQISANQQNVDNAQSHRMQEPELKLKQQFNDLKINGIVQSVDYNHLDRDGELQGERCTPTSTISSSDDSNAIHQIELLSKLKEDNDRSTLLGSSPIRCNSSQNIGQQSSSSSSGLSTDNTNSFQSQLNHRTIFQTDNNSFFSSNNFHKVSTSVPTPSTAQAANSSVDWMNLGHISIPDSLPTVYSSEDWQAAFGFQNESPQPNRFINKPNRINTPRVPFHSEDFIVDDTYTNSQYPSNSSTIVSNILVNSSATKFMADFQQNSLQQRLVMQAQQNYENSEYLKQNGYTSLNKVQTLHDVGPSVKADDELGFDPFHETQKALAELMENEIQIQQQRLFQQQQQQLKEREDNRVQLQCTLGSQHFSQVAHLAHLQQQAQQLQSLHALQQSHSLLSRLPQDFIQQNSGQGTITVAQLGQRSRLPPPGFPGSSPNHMNSFGLGIPRPAPSNNTFSDLLMSTGNKMLPFVSHSSGGLSSGQAPHHTPYLLNQNSVLNSQGNF